MADLAHVDANVLVRLLTGDDPGKQLRARQLMERAAKGEVELFLAVTTVFDTFVVLTSPNLYGGDRERAAEALLVLASRPGVRVENRATVLRALGLISTLRTLGDAMIAAIMERDEMRTLYSFDRGFDRIDWIERREP
jgi:predicted nucleic acid-binding protein